MRTGYFFVSLACLFLLAVGSAPAAVHTISLDGESVLRLLEQTDDALTFEVRVGELTAMDVHTPAGDYTRLSIPGFHHSRDVGEPALPMLKRLCEIPYAAAVSVEILGCDSRVIRLADHGIHHPIIPAQPSVPKNADPSTLPFRVNSAAYQPGNDIVRDLVAVEDVGRLRGLRLGRLEVAPINYDPGEGTITVHHSIRFTVHFPGADHAEGQRIKQCTDSPFFDIVYSRVAGFRTPHEDHPDLMQGRVSYVIVSDPMFEAELQPFIAWKTQQGFDVIEAYTDQPEVGNTTYAIRDYLHGLYNSGVPGNPSPTFVLFVGDVNLVPCWQLSGATDLPYCDVTGDNIPEMYYGRFSARNLDELTPQIEKTLEYEQCTMPDPSYLAEVVLIAGMDSNYAWNYGNGQINYGTRHYFNADHGIDGHIYLYPQSGSSGPQIKQDVSDGVAYVNYSAHGYSGGWANPSFNNYDIDQLENEHEYCLAVGNCCSTSEFDVGDCFAEHWLRADRKGAIGYIGGSNGTYWDEDYWWGVGFGPVIADGPDYEQTGLGVYDGAWHDHGEGIGQWFVVQDALIFCGNLAVVEGGGMATYYWRIYNLMGDPSLSVNLGEPTSNAVVHDAFIDAEQAGTPQLFHVEAEPNSYVGLSKDGNVIGGGMVGTSGSASIWVRGQGTQGMAQMVVTCQNKFPYFADIPVNDPSGIGDAAPGGLRLVYNSPNPFNLSTHIQLNLEQSEVVSLRVHDMSGRVIRTLVAGSLSAGQHSYSWDGRDAAGRFVPGGVYLARLTGDRESRSWKLVLSQ